MIGRGTSGPCGLQTVLDAALTCDATQSNFDGSQCIYNLVIEGFSSAEGLYSVIMNCDTEYDGTIACGETVTGSTVGAGSTIGNGASDHLYAFTLATPMNLQMDSCASTYDTYLRIMDENLGQEYTSCDDVRTQAVCTPQLGFHGLSLTDCLCFQCGACGLHTILDAQLEAGNFMLVIEGFSNEEGDYSVTMNCPGQGGGVSLPVSGSVELVGSVDDAEEAVATTLVTTDSSDLELCFDNGAEQVVGLRFRGVSINQGSAVLETFIDFTVDEVNAESQQSIALTVRMELSGDSPEINQDPASNAADLSRRPTTRASERWSPEISLVALDTLTTGNLNHLMAEVVAQPSWVAGNSVMFLFSYDTGPGIRWVKHAAGSSFGSAWTAPTLRWTFDEVGFADGAIACGDTVHGTTDGAGTHVGNGASDHVYTFDVTVDMVDRANQMSLVTFDSCGSEFDTYLRIFDRGLTTEVNGCDDW